MRIDELDCAKSGVIVELCSVAFAK